MLRRFQLRRAFERGFTLIEVLIAMVILTIAMVSMAELMAITLRMQMMGRNETAAIRLAQSKIDELVAVNFTNATVAVGGSLSADVANYFDVLNADGFKRRWQITAIAGKARVRTLTVRMIPNIADRRTNAQVELTTIIRDP
jgi:prepilin-type N-terminal cleavage/methylation domain-containing protein